MDPAAKHRAVLDAAEALFVAQGYDGASIADIAGAADVAVGTVYRFHADKAALLTALHQRMENRFIEATLAGWASGDDHRGRFNAMFAAIFAEAGASRAAMPLYGMTKTSVGDGYSPGAAMIAAIETLVATAQAEGGLIDGDPALLAAVAYGMTDAALRHWLAAGESAPPAAHVDALARLASRAFIA